MTERATPPGARPRAFLVLGAACALLPSLAMWGFTVDDALIAVRYAHHVATGAGYRFDAIGPSTDGVTPLPWAFLLAPLAAGGAMTTLLRAKMLGVAAWTVGGAALGARVGTIAGRERAQTVLAAASLVVMGLAFSIGAWAASGMETGLATALATVTVTRMGRPRQVAVLAGLTAALRPEMVVWAVAIATGAVIACERAREPERDGGGGRGREGGRGVREALGAAGIAFLPFAVCVVLRMIFFGRAAPLAVLAKPSDLLHGWSYAGAAAFVVLTPLQVCAPLALWRARRAGGAVVVAFVAHALAVVGAGGDWMPYARLFVPVAPSLVIAFVELSKATRPAWSVARLAAAGVLGVLLAMGAAPAGRRVYLDRADLVERARPALEGAHVVAALDVGWVGAATEAQIVDLGGLTDPAIALLPGGMTSKRVDVPMLLDRGVDTVIVYSDLRVVEIRILRSELFQSRFEVAVKLPVGSRGAFYTVYRRRVLSDAATPAPIRPAP